MPGYPTAPASLSELLVALRAREAPLPFEIGTFLALEVCEVVLRRPSTPTAGCVRIETDGSLTVTGLPPVDAAPASEADCARSVLQLLAQVLSAAEPGLPPALLALVERASSPEPSSVLQVRDELEALLVPLNRGAARRVLARMLREVQRHQARVRHGDPRRGGRHPVDPVATSEEQLDAAFDGLMAALDPPASAVPTVDAESPAPRDWRLRTTLAVTGLLGLLAALVLYPRVSNTSAFPWPAAATDAVEIEAERVEEVGSRVGARGSLNVRSWPSRAQVYRLVGQGDEVAWQVLTGVAHELMIVVEGRGQRVLLGPNAEWQACAEGHCYELAITAAGDAPMVALSDPGASHLPLESVADAGPLGWLRVRSEHPDARVYELMGFTPHVQLEGVDTSAPLQLMVLLGEHEAHQPQIQPYDWVLRDGALVADLDVRLMRRR